MELSGRGYRLFCGDCLDVMPTLAANSADVVIADPPYYRIVREAWDRQWDTPENYLDFIEAVAIQCKRILKPKGSLFIFGDDKIIAYVQVRLDKHLTLLNNLVWFKTNNLSIKAAANLRSFAPMTERILFYTPQLCRTGLETVKLDLNNFVSLRDYFRDYQDSLSMSINEINTALGHRRAEHAFYWNSTQWDLPTAETYAELNSLPANNKFLRREYEDLRREYEDLRRVFNADASTLDVICGPIINGNDNTEHPTTKPLWLIKRLIETSTHPGNIILDPFMGSGTTGVAALATGRQFIGIEMDKDYFEIARRRIEHAAREQAGEFHPIEASEAVDDLPLFQLKGDDQ